MEAADGAAGERLFRGLGRGLVRHPTWPILFWVLLLLVTVPFLGRIGSVTANSATTLPASAPSAVANAQLAAEFPRSSGGSQSLLVVSGNDVTGPTGQNVTLALAAAIAGDRSLVDVAGVTDLYTAYAHYLAGNGEIAALSIATADTGPTPLPSVTNATADLVWGTVGRYVSQWQSLVSAHPGTAPASWNYPAENATLALLGNSTAAGGLLEQFYGSVGGFNASTCGNDPATVEACAEGIARGALNGSPPVVSTPDGDQILEGLGIGNFSTASAQGIVIDRYLAATAGIPTSVFVSLTSSFPQGAPDASGVAAWSTNIADNTSVTRWPVPPPPAIWRQYVAPDGAATIVQVSYSVSDSTTDSSGGTPVFEDVSAINSLVPRTLDGSDPTGGFTAQQTGPAALDATENTVLGSTLAIVLPLTVVTLIGITIVYFRSPVAPAVSFAGIGIALGLGLGGVVLIGTLLGPVDSNAITLATTFVLGVGTDYSIFLIARYREELWGGASHDEALVTTVTWAGQSIATSGATAVLATLALAFSGVALLSQWGEALSFAVLMAVLVSLTFVPACLKLLGPRVFWPSTGARFQAAAEATVARRAAEQTYFFRTARRVARRPGLVVILVLAASVPLAYVAVTAPVSYDFYGQLPSGQISTDGLATLGQHFGPGFAFPIVVLVTFQAPLVGPGNASNATEFTDLATLTTQLNTTAGVAGVGSPVGPDGAPLSVWQSLAAQPPGARGLLAGTLAGYVGVDGRTVLLSVTPAAAGLSNAAVSLLATLKGEVGGFASTHPDIASVAYGGGASETNDIRDQVGLATERMAIAVSIGLVLVLLVVLRSAVIPPMAVATIGLSIGWAWGITNLVLTGALGLPLFYFAPTVLFILILGLGIDYNIFLLTRVREERLRGRTTAEATVHSVASTGGIITAAAIILASAFAILITGQFLLLQAIGFAVAAAVLLDAMVVRTYLVPASLFLLGDRVWWWPARRKAAGDATQAAPDAAQLR